MHLIQGLKSHCEFETNLIYRVSFRTAKATKKNPVLKNQNKQTKCVYPVTSCTLRQTELGDGIFFCDLLQICCNGKES